MTYREFYTTVINANLSEEMTTFAQHAIAIIDNKNSRRKEEGTPKQKENAALKEKIIEYINNNPQIHVSSEIAKQFEISTSKASALLSQLGTAGQIEVIDGYKPEKSKSKVKGYAKIKN